MSVIDDYLAKQPPTYQAELDRLRRLVHQTVPDATEAISYGMPVFRYKDTYLVGFAAFKNHFGFFPTSEPIAALQTKLSDFKTSKGGVRYTAAKPLPDDLITQMVLHRKAAIDQGKST